MKYVISYVDKMMWQLTQQPFQKNEKNYCDKLAS